MIFSILLALFPIAASQDSSTLQFIQVWFRHGERLPTHYLKFPSDTEPNDRYQELAEQGELTNRGIQQEYRLGQQLKERYGSFLGDYLPHKIHVWTGKDNRTVASAQALMAGLYPPSKDRMWMADLNWQPVSMHTEESLDWLSTGIQIECPLYEKEIFTSEAFRSIPSQMNQSLLQLLQEGAGGVRIDNVVYINRLIDSLRVRSSLNDSRLPVPDWAIPPLSYLQPAHEQLHSLVLDVENETVGAYHNEMILSYMEDHLSRPTAFPNNIAVFLAGHDTNFMAIGKSLGIEDMSTVLPNFAAHMVVELHLINGIYYVQFFKTGGIDLPLTKVNPTSCPEPCSLKRLQEIVTGHRLSRPDMIRTCNGVGEIGAKEGIITGAMITLIGVLLLSTVILACTTCSYKKQLRDIQDPERHRLI